MGRLLRGGERRQCCSAGKLTDNEDWWRRTKHFHGESVFDDPETENHQIADRLFDLLRNHDFRAEEQAFLGGLIKSLYGRMPYHRLKVVKPKPGGKIAFAARIERAEQAMAMADIIDMKVADGTKQDAAVLAASVEYGVSEREVFRRLKEMRLERLKSAQYPSLMHFHLPEGFTVDDEGKLERLPLD